MSTLEPPPHLNALERLAWLQEHTQWSCKACLIHNKIEDYRCKACEEPRPGFEEKCKQEDEQKKQKQSGISANGFSFNTPSKSANQASAFSFGKPASDQSNGESGFKFTVASSNSSGFTFGATKQPANGFQFSSKPITFGGTPFKSNANPFGPFTPNTANRFSSLTVANSTIADDGKERETPPKGEPSSDEDPATSSDEEAKAQVDRNPFFANERDRARAHKQKKYDLRRMNLRRKLEGNLSRIPPGTSVVCATGDGSMNGVLGLGCQGDDPDVASNFPCPIPLLFGKRLDLIATGAMSCAALTNNNELYVWGSNEHGELGENPRDIPDLGDEADIPTDRAEQQKYDEYKRRLEAIYGKHCPDKMEKIEGFLEKARVHDNHHVLYKRICEKYNEVVEAKFKPSLSDREKREIRQRMLNPSKYLTDVKDEREFARRASCIYWTPARMRIPQHVRIASIDFGAAHVAILDEDGIVYSMGTFNSDGLVGHHYTEEQNELKLFERSFCRVNDLLPTDQRGRQLKPIRQIACGANHFLMLDDNNDVFQMGVTQLGQRTSARNQKLYLRPHQVPSIMHQGKRVKFCRVRCGDHHNMAISTAGEVFGWGQNNFFQCGVPQRHQDYNSVVDRPRHVDFPEIISAVDVQCGQHFSVVLDKRGRVWSFGRNVCNQLGRKTRRPPRKLMNGALIRQECEKDLPRLVPGLDEIDLIAAGTSFWFARSKSNRRKVVAFGFGNLGSCGVGNWHAASGRCVFDDTILPNDFYVSGICGGANHSVFLLDRIDPNAVERVSASSMNVDTDGEADGSDGRGKKRSRHQMERDSTSPPDMNSPPKKSQRTAARKKSRRRRKSAR